jgi:hypothetical protein
MALALRLSCMPKAVSKRPTPPTHPLVGWVATGPYRPDPLLGKLLRDKRPPRLLALVLRYTLHSSWSRVLFTPPHLPPTHEQAYTVVLQAATMAATNQAPSMEEESEAGKCDKPSGPAVFSCPSSNASTTPTHICFHASLPPLPACLTPPPSPPHTTAKALWEITNSPGLAKKGPSCLTPRGPAGRDHLLGFPTPQGVGHGSPSMNYNRYVLFSFLFGGSLFVCVCLCLNLNLACPSSKSQPV